MSCALSALMGLVFYGTVPMPMIVTGLLCAVIIDSVVARITARYRDALRRAKRDLEHRVAERTAELEALNAELKREARERSALEQQLVDNERMAAAGAMAAAIGHEIRNPLMATTMSLELAEERMFGATRQELLEIIKGAAEGAAQVQRIAVDLSTLAKPAAVELGPVDVPDAVAVAARLVQHHIRGVAELSVELDDTEQVLANKPRLVQVFLNLLTNAAQSSVEGRINKISVGSEVSDREYVVVVRDTGRGMTAGELSHVFEPFFTTRASDGGTGLGLAICRNIVSGAGGSLSIDSELGHGTTVRVALRLHEQRELISRQLRVANIH